ncbi:MAG: transporter substrate-binding domain-containing protein [Gallionella sp.]|nr:transporter substrate-binding domain-containing protein [Gallionella sp.]
MILFVLMMPIAQESHAEVGTIVFQSTETPPIWSETMTNGGMGCEILHLLSEIAGVKYAIHYLPVKRFNASTAPYLVGNPNLLTTEKNRAILPIGVFHLAYFYYRPHHDVIKIRSIEDLSGHTIGVLRGTIEDMNPFARLKIKVQESDSNETLLRMLQKGRIDVAIMVDLTGRHLIQTEFADEQHNFMRIIVPDSVRPIAIMMEMDTPNGQDIAQRYHQALRKAMHSPQYHEIMQKYYGKGTAANEAHLELTRLLDYYESTWEDDGTEINTP